MDGPSIPVILLGLFTVWLVFDQLWGALASVEMKKVFISNLRWLAQFAREPLLEERKVAIKRSYFLRETINPNVWQMESSSNSVPPSEKPHIRGGLIRFEIAYEGAT